MVHIALYRKWRPELWEDLVGQEHISRTLINAIETNKIAHAYMFCGSRGTGKTTTARILAKALNCEARVDGSPCNKCQSCHELSSGASLDVIEIDAASNRGIGEIKSLIEQVRFASVSGKHKVYIIDEFHMLTTEAFNALLKTLEEPPPKVIFILATTEAHKILPTIVSRCQRFDFQRIPIPVLIKRLRYISDQENILISNDSLLSIARKANGGLRDALSLLDQISAFSIGNGEIPTELVFQVLGMISGQFLTKLAEAIAKSEPIVIIETLSELLKAGNDPIVITTEMVTFFRHLLVVKSSPEMAEQLEVPVSNLDSFKTIAELFTVKDILYCLEFLNEAIDRIKKTQMAQLWLEVNFVQLCRREEKNSLAQASNSNNNIQTVAQPVANNSAEINTLLGKINNLEKRLEQLSQRSFAPTTNNQRAYQNNETHLPSDSEPVTNTSPNPDINTSNLSQNNLKGIWERILHETNKKSIPTAALLKHGRLAEIDEKIGTITLKFENEGFIELLKNSKYEKVEQALHTLFGKPYRLIMEKDYKEEKKNDKFQPVKEIETNFSRFSVSEPVANFDTSKIVPISSVETFTPPTPEVVVPKEEKELVSVAVSTEQDETTLLKVAEMQQEYVAEVLPTTELMTTEEEPITVEVPYPQVLSQSQPVSNEELVSTQKAQEKINEQRDFYFNEVADVFKGKIIKNK